MAKSVTPSAYVLARVRESLVYSHSTGALRWNFTEKKLAHHNGKLAGRIAPRGYRIIRITDRDGRRVPLFAHRIAWFKHYSVWPAFAIDHKNRDKAFNAIGNLRRATKHIDRYNRSLGTNNTSGVRGVNYEKRSGRWRAEIICEGEYYFLGRFESFAAAVEARQAAEINLYGRLCASSDGRCAQKPRLIVLAKLAA